MKRAIYAFATSRPPVPRHNERTYKFGAAQRLFGCFITSLRALPVARSSISNSDTITPENLKALPRKTRGIVPARDDFQHAYVLAFY